MSPRLARAMLFLLVAAVLAWLGGFVWFAATAWWDEPAPARADGIVALTGGAGRVETALTLLADGHARVALVSGVGATTDFATLARRAGIDPALRVRVTLGRAATSTYGNAAETAEWVHANDLHSLIVVTAGYHMRRALAELGRALPGVALHPAPVVPAALRRDKWASLRLLAGEYNKWLAVEAGLSAIASRGEARPEGHAAPLGDKGQDGKESE